MNDEQDTRYAEFLLASGDERMLICNGHMLTKAMEEGFLYEEFLAQEADNTW